MMILHRHAGDPHQLHRRVAEIAVAVLGRDAVITVEQAEARRAAEIVAQPLGGGDAVADAVGLDRVLHLIERVIFQLHQHFGVVGDLLVAQVPGGVSDDVARILLEGDTFVGGGNDVAEHVHGVEFAASFQQRPPHVGNGHHVGIADFGVAVVGAVETDAVAQNLFGRVLAGQRHRAQVAPQVDHHQVQKVHFRPIAVKRAQIHDYRSFSSFSAVRPGRGQPSAKKPPEVPSDTSLYKKLITINQRQVIIKDDSRH